MCRKCRWLLAPCLKCLFRKRKYKDSDEDLTIFDGRNRKRKSSAGFLSSCFKSKKRQTLYPLDSIHVNIEDIGNA